LYDQRPLAMALGSDGSILLAGEFQGSFTFDPGAATLTSMGDYDIFLAKLSSDGKLTWSRGYGNGAPQRALGVAATPDGGAAIAGETYGQINFGGALMAAQGKDAFVAAYDGSGGHRFSRLFGDGFDQRATSIAADGAGDIILTGEFYGTLNVGAGLPSHGSRDIFVMKLDGKGGPVWAQGFGDVNEQLGPAVTVDRFGNIILAGEWRGTENFGNTSVMSGSTDAFAAKLSPSGKGVWGQVFGDGASQQRCFGVATDAEGNVLVGGEFDGSVAFGGLGLSNSGGRDGFAAKLSP
jgi:hypothetical protein